MHVNARPAPAAGAGAAYAGRLLRANEEVLASTDIAPLSWPPSTRPPSPPASDRFAPAVLVCLFFAQGSLEEDVRRKVRLDHRVPLSTLKYPRVPGSTRKYPEVPGSALK